ncbi:hypothetical protein [Clostridium saudiense]|uniref:hypothetical protein n=1 Tax=Clostridium saudiense TaxID=1414720 RepID=UPI0018AA4331|nr:hypothetical protein [Clostridium saudiense]
MGKAIDEKHLDIQEIEKLKINLALANTEIKKLKKDIEILKKAVNIDVKNININPNEEIDESSIGLDNINEIDIRFIDDTKVKEEYTISGQEPLSEDFSKEKKEDTKDEEKNKSILEFVVEEESIDDLEEDEICIEIKEQEEEVVDLELQETKEKANGISMEEIDEEVQLGLEKISEEIELGFKNIADEIIVEEEIALAVEELKEEEIKEQEIITEDEILTSSEEVITENSKGQKEDTISNVEHIIESIENKITKEDDIENKGLFIKIKKAFIENNNYECIITLNKIIDEISEIEQELVNEDKIVLLYLSYFYDKLNDLLEKSEIINEFYISENEESKLLKMIIDEKEFDLNQEVDLSVNNILKRNKKIFNSLETIIKVNIIEKINNIIYKNFDEVFSINDIAYGVDTLNIKAWVKKKDEVKWKLVEGLYSSDNNKLYMLESAISILKLNYDNTSKPTIEEDSNILKKEVAKKNINSQVNYIESNKMQIKNEDINSTLKIERDEIIKAKPAIKSKDIDNNDSKHGWGKLKNMIFRKNKKENKK